MSSLISRLIELRKKLTLEDVMLLIGIMYLNDIVEMLLTFVRGVLREIVRAL